MHNRLFLLPASFQTLFTESHAGHPDLPTQGGLRMKEMTRPTPGSATGMGKRGFAATLLLLMLFGAQSAFAQPSHIISANRMIHSPESCAGGQDSGSEGIGTGIRNSCSRDTRTLFSFDLSIVDPDSVITSAKLRLYCSYQSEYRTNQVYVSRLTSPWDPYDATYLTNDGSTYWSPGGDLTNQDEAVITIPQKGTGQSQPYEEWFEWNITDIAQGWFAGTFDNVGVVLWQKVDPYPDGWNQELIFTTLNNLDSSIRPQLILEGARFIVPSMEWVRAATEGPPEISERGLVYDVFRNACLLPRSGGTGENWAWDGSSWTLLPIVGPMNHGFYGLAFDQNRGIAVLFGGQGDPNILHGDTWEYDGSSWTQVATTGPSPRNALSMAFDSNRGKTVLFGGDSGIAGLCGDTWEWNGVGWQQVAITGPSARSGTALAYDSRRRKTVLFGGWDGSVRGDTWEWDGTTWTQVMVSGPPDRQAHTMAYDAARDVVLLFGGENTTMVLGDTWEYNGSEWYQILTSAAPAARRRHVTTYDSARDAIVLLGGTDLSSALPPETWEYRRKISLSAWNYDHDLLDRLARIDSGNGIRIAYTYDSAGNRLEKEVTSQLLLSPGAMNPLSGGMDNNAVAKSVLQVALDVSSVENLTLERIEFAGSGSGHETENIASVKLWLDVNGDGLVDGGDTQIGSAATFSSDNGVVVFSSLSQVLPSGQRSNLLLTYDLNGSALQNETFSASMVQDNKIFAMDEDALQSIYALGAPVAGATLTISTDTTPPVFSGIEAATGLDQSAYLEWQPATDASTPITYHIWQGTESFEGTVTGQPAYTTQDLNYTVSGLVNGQPYYFVVRAADSAGNTDTNTVEGYAVPQAALFVLTATAGPNGSVHPEPNQFVYETGNLVYVIPEGITGYHFVSWTGDAPSGHETDDPLVLTMDANKTVEASFERSKGTVRVQVTPSDASWGFLDGDGALHEGMGNADIVDIPTGTISLTWQPLVGYAAPPSPDPSNLPRNGAVTFSGIYGPEVVFTVLPEDQRRYIGDAAEFLVSTTGGLGALEYQWWFDDGQKAIPLVDGNAPVLLLTDLVLGDSGSYWCVITDEVPATYSCKAALLDVSDHLQITQEPEGGDKTARESHTFVVTTRGGIGTLSYLWQKDETSIEGANDASYTIPSLMVADTGSYTVMVMDECGDIVQSNPAVLNVDEGLPLLGIAAVAAFLILLGVAGVITVRYKWE